MPSAYDIAYSALIIVIIALIIGSNTDWLDNSEQTEAYLDSLELESYVVGDSIDGLDGVVFSGYEFDSKQLILNDNGIPLYYALSIYNKIDETTSLNYVDEYILEDKKITILNSYSDMRNGILRVNVK